MLVQMALCFCNSFSSSMRNGINLLLLFLSSTLSLNVSTYPWVLGNINTYGFIASSRYPIKHLNLLFISINFEMTILLHCTKNEFSH